MPFTTRKVLCEAIDNVDHAIQCAIKDGNLFNVFDQFKHEYLLSLSISWLKKREDQNLQV